MDMLVRAPSVLRVGLLLIAMLLAASGTAIRAQAGPVSCGCYCGISLSPPCSDDACKAACGWTEPQPIPDFTPDPLLHATTLYDDVVRRLAPYLENGNEWLAAAPPASIDDLHGRLQNFYTGLWLSLYRVQVQGGHLRSSAQALEWAIQSDAQLAEGMRQEIAGLAAREAEQQTVLEDARRSIEEHQQIMLRFGAESSYWQDRAQQARNNVVAWLWTFGPDSLLKVNRDTLAYLPIAVGPGSVRVLEKEVPPLQLQPAGPAAAAAAEPDPPPAPVPFLEGDTPTRVAQIDSLGQQLAGEWQNIEYFRSRIAELEPQAAAVRAERDNVAVERDRLAASVSNAQAALLDLGHNVRQMQEEVRAARESFAYRVAEAWLWENWRDTVVKVELQRFAEKNMLWGNLRNLSNEDVDELFSGGNKAWSFYAWRGRDEFVEVQDKTLGFLHQTEGFAEQAARLLAQAPPDAIETFADEVFGRFDAHTSDLAKTALRDITGFAPFDMVAHRLVGFGG